MWETVVMSRRVHVVVQIRVHMSPDCVDGPQNVPFTEQTIHSS